MHTCTKIRISFRRSFGKIDILVTSDLIRVCLFVCFQNKIVRFCDPITRVILLRVRRNDCSKVRAAITLLTSIPTSNSNSSGIPTVSSNHRGSDDVVPIIASIISIHGCLRTAKLGTMKSIKHMYRTKLLQLQNWQNDKFATTTTKTNRRGNDDDVDDDDTAASYRSNKKKKQKMTTTSATTTTTNNNNIHNTKERRELLRQLDDVLVSIQTME